MKTILVTGANGFVGRHLIRELHSQGHRIIGVGGPNPAKDAEQSLLAEYHACDLTNAEAVATLDLTGVDAIIHLAALASVQLSFAEPARFIADNGAISINLFEALMKQQIHPRVIVISTGAVYTPDQPMPITEAGVVDATSPYVVSKLLTENICAYYRSRGIPTVVVRPFNHIGPGQGPGFLLPDLAAQIQDAEREKKAVSVGNLKTQRDYTDVRDVVKAYHLLAIAETLQYDIYNVCSGKSVAGEYFLEQLAKTLTPNHSPEVVVDISRFRPNDAPIITGDSTRLQKETGWRPLIPLEQTIADFATGLVTA